jgi:DNA polymerase-1
MARILLIDGNSILNRAFYGIMGSKMLMTDDGTYTNAVYGFLSILFKVQEELTPEYLVVAFDKKGPTKRHELYKEYKANRKGMPEELAAQMPIIKEILTAMNIKIIEKEGYEGDDIIGTLSRFGEKNGLEVTILSGDRDNFQLATDKITIEIPRTKAGKTETDYYDRNKVIEEYGVEPYQLIQVKGLMGDTSDNIPGVPGVGEKTALQLIKDYKDIDNLYNALENGTDSIKGKLREKLIQNKDLAFLSRELGRINIDSPIEENLEEMKVVNWDKETVFKLFKKYRFNRYIERFSLQGDNDPKEESLKFEIKEIKTQDELEELVKTLNNKEEIVCYFGTKDNNGYIIPKEIISISIYADNSVFYYEFDGKTEEFIKYFKNILETKKIIGYELSGDYILLKQIGIEPNIFYFDAKIAAYLLNPVASKYPLEGIGLTYANIDINEYLQQNGVKEEKTQLNLFDTDDNMAKDTKQKQESIIYAYTIAKLYDILIPKLREEELFDLFTNIEMPLVKVLADMQYVGMKVNKQELIDYGYVLKEQLEELTNEIYNIVGEEFNINSPKQLGEILFEKLKLPYGKKTKNGYSTDVDALEKIREEHPVVQKILDYRAMAKLNSTYVEGLLPYINENDQKIHSYFHQTVTATGRISSTEPNLQNIPTRVEAGKKIRKAFKPSNGCIFVDADYSQIELRVLAHISEDEHMLEAFRNDEDIHKQAASKVLNIPIEEVTKEQRSNAKAVNFGIVYGISDFGLAGQLGISKKQAKEYIDQYLEKYSGIKNFMDNVVEEAKEKGYAETLFKRKRQIPELKSSNYMVRQFGARAAMNTPIQGTAADIMKIAMIDVFNRLKNENLKSKLVLQVHDELLIDTVIEEKDRVCEILKTSMENAIKLKIPLKVELSVANDWCEAK